MWCDDPVDASEAHLNYALQTLCRGLSRVNLIESRPVRPEDENVINRNQILNTREENQPI